MIKNKLKDNTLIKRKNLIIVLKKYGISRTSPDALKKIESLITEDIKKLASALSEIIKIKGRKTLLTRDIEEIIEEKKSKKYPEI